MSKEYGHFIGGEWCTGTTENTIDSINPATGALLWTIQQGTPEDINKAITAAKECYYSGEWQSLSYHDRADILREIAEVIEEHSGLLSQIETQENGKPIKESSLIDIPEAAKVFRTYASLVLSLKGETFPTDGSTFTYTQYEPLGVVAQIVPWNYPLLMAAWKIAPALAAGNTIVMKPSELTSASLLTLCEKLSDTVLPKGALNVVTGIGEEIGPTLTGHMGIAKVSFTGSTKTGRAIVESTAINLAPVTLELGGKSPTIVCEDCNLESTARTILTTIFMNQGQMCVAGSRLLIHESIYKKFTELLAQKASALVIASGERPTTDMGPLISTTHREKVSKMVAQAIGQGAVRITPLQLSEIPTKGAFFPPTILSNVTSDMDIWNEEVFGPVLITAPYNSINNAITLANSSEYGLAASIWTNNQAYIQRAIRALNVGTVWVNTYGAFSSEVPFGGFKNSGYGKELGLDSLKSYSRKKTVTMDTTPNQKPLVSGWYSI
ncbi:MAG: aldehyde dehydrogenase family protein [Fibrobacterales bacterium]